MSFFSVVIPLFNKENYIQNTLKSVLNQEFSDVEIIIVDDKSTDKSLQKAREIKDARIKIIENQKNVGLSASRNIGIKASSTNYIAFLDADDLWKPFFLSEVYSMIKIFPEAKIFGTRYEEILPNSNKTIPIKINSKAYHASPRIIDNFFEINIQQPMYCYSSVVFNKEVFNNSGYFDEKITLSEDIDFNIRCNLHNVLCYSNKVCASYFLFSENQITTSSIENKITPNFNQYESLCTEENQLKKYLDFNRYVISRIYKNAKLLDKYLKLKNEIDCKNLTLKQKILLNSPLFLDLFISKIKSFFLRLNIKFTSYN